MISSIKVVVPVRNAKDWITRCISSIATQDYDGTWSCIVIDDASDDGTQDAIIAAFDSMTPEIRKKFKVKLNSERAGALKNFVDGFKELGSLNEPESVLVQVDGDDWLYGPLVFQILRSAYEQTGCWITWGNYIEWPSGAPGMSSPIANETHMVADYRQREWVTSHLRTFKSHLWNSIRDEDLRDSSGGYFMTTCDLAMMFPMLEMARERSLFIPYVLHCYNRSNPQSDDRVYREEQLAAETVIRKRVPYGRK